MVSFIALCSLLLLGHILRSKLRFLQWLYLPSCVIGGLAGLAIIQIVGQGDMAGLIAWQIPDACDFLGIRLGF